MTPRRPFIHERRILCCIHCGQVFATTAGNALYCQLPTCQRVKIERMRKRSKKYEEARKRWKDA